MFQNNYGTLIETWKVNLILARAKRMGFRRHDLEDAQQRIVLAMLRFEFDETRSNGATEVTALVAVIDHQLITMKRAKDRYAQRVGQRDEVFGGDDVSPPTPCDGVNTAQAMDIRQAVADLPPLAQQICQALSEGLSTHEIACRHGIGWHTVRRQVRGIRRYFEHLGLDAWLLA